MFWAEAAGCLAPAAKGRRCPCAVLLTPESALVQHSCSPAGGQVWIYCSHPSPAGQEDAEAWLCHGSTVWSGLVWEHVEQHLLVGMRVLRAILEWVRSTELPKCLCQ